MMAFIYERGCPFCKQCYDAIQLYNAEVHPKWRIAQINKWGEDTRLPVIAKAIGKGSPYEIPVPLLWIDIYEKPIAVIGVTTDTYYEGWLEKLKEEANREEGEQYVPTR